MFFMGDSQNKLGILSFQFYSYPDEFGGAWKYTYEVNKRMVKRGHQVYLVTCKPTADLPDYEVIDGIHYFRIGVKESKSLLGLWCSLKKRISLILDRYPVHIVNMHNPLIAFIALLNPRIWRIPGVYHFHSLWFDEEKINRLATQEPVDKKSLWFRIKIGVLLNCIRLLEWTCFYSACSILFLSKYTKNKFEEFYPLKKLRLSIIPGGVDVETFRPLEFGKNELKKRLQLPADRLILFTVRRLAARMGLENLILAVSLIKSHRSQGDFLLIIGGKGPLEEKLNELITGHHLQDCVRLIGCIPEEKLPLYYQSADLFVIPSALIEGFGLVTVEAMASGLPVLGTPVGGTKEILENIDERLLFDDTTPEAIAARIELFLKNPQPFLDLKSKCREEAVIKYSWDHVVDQVEEEFYNVVIK